MYLLNFILKYQIKDRRTYIGFPQHSPTHERSPLLLYLISRWRRAAAGFYRPCRRRWASRRRPLASARPGIRTCWGRRHWRPLTSLEKMSRSPQWKLSQFLMDLLPKTFWYLSIRWLLVATLWKIDLGVIWIAIRIKKKKLNYYTYN